MNLKLLNLVNRDKATHYYRLGNDKMFFVNKDGSSQDLFLYRKMDNSTASIANKGSKYYGVLVEMRPFQLVFPR